MKLYERIENNNFDEIDRNRAIELIKGGNGHLVYNENYFKLQKENEELKEDRDKFKKALGKRITYCNELEKDLFENCSKYVIPIQKIKDKIEEYKNMLKTCNKEKDIDRIKAINERILELQELIENEIDIDSIEELEVRQNYGCEIINEDNIHLLFKRQNQILQAVKQIDKRVKKLEGK